MLKNSSEYKEAVRESYNAILSESHQSSFSFQIWKQAFEAGFDAGQSPEITKELKEILREKLENTC